MSGGKNAAVLLIASSLFWSVVSCAAEYTLDFTCGVAHDAEAPVLRRAEMPAVVGTVPAVAVGDTLNLRLFGDVDYALRIVSAPPAGIAGQSFIAKDANGSASAIVKVSEKTARISVDDFMNRRQYTVRCKDGKVLIVERDNSQMDDGECGTCGGEIEVPQPAVEETKTTSTKKSRTLLGASGNEFPLAEQKSVVDILVAFDNGAKAWVEGGNCPDADTIEEFADYAINKMNTVLQKSQLDHLFFYRLVGITQVDATYKDITNPILNSLRVGEAPFSHIPALRDYYGADIVTLLVDVDESASSYTTGIGYPLGGADGDAIASNAVGANSIGQTCNVCHIRRVWNRYTMSHEVGHNMGCGHSNRQGSNSGPQSTSYSCGYHFLDASGKPRYTVMGYNYTPDASYYFEAIPYYSTPDITPEEYGVPVGTEEKNNNRKVLTLSYKGVSEWREHSIPYEWDVRFLDSSGNDISHGQIFEDSIQITLTGSSSYPESARIYLTLDGTTPNTTSIPYRFNTSITIKDTTTLTACIVTNGVAESMRSIKVVKGAPPVPGFDWQTDGDHPWSIASDTDWTNGTTTVLHNYEYGYEYGPDKTAVLSTTLEGPKRFYFRHKSNFGSQSEGKGVWGRFSVVCEDGGAFSTTESSMTWERDFVDIPSGTHKLAIVYNQGNTHYSTSGVWLDDLQIVDNQTEVAISPRDVASFNGTIPVTLTADKAGQTIYYTTDGSTPTTSSAQYSSPISVTENCTIKAIAVDGNGKASAVFASNYRCKNKGNADMSTWLGDSTRVWSGSPQNEWGTSASTYIFNYKFADGALHNYTWLGTLVEGPKLMSFTYKTMFLTGSAFTVTIDGETVMSDTTGSSSDITRSVAIPEGTHDVRFVYSQNNIGATTGKTHGLFLRRVSFTENVPLAWSGEAGQNGNGRWMDDSAVLAWNDSAYGFANLNQPTVTFGDIEGNAAPVVTVKGAVNPKVADISATTCAYTFAKGDDDAFISLPLANFSPSNNVTFEVPIKMESTSFTVADGKTYTFNAPFGQSATKTCATNSNVIVVGNASTLNVSPGEGNTQVFSQFNNSGMFYSNAKFNVGAGTTIFTANGNGRGLFGSLQITAKDNGRLVFEGRNTLADNANTSIVNVEGGGGIIVKGMVNFRRKLNFKGGSFTVAGDNESYGRAFELYNAPTISVSADSLFDSSGEKTASPYVYLRQGSPTFTFSNNATLTNNIIYADGTANFADANGGINISGTGTFIQNSFNGQPLTYVGVTSVGGGMTLVMNAEHQNTGAYSIASGARLTGSGAITGDGIVTLEGSNAKLCGSLSVKNLVCANGTLLGDQWTPVSANVTGSLSTKADGAAITVTNGYLAIGAECDVSGFATANLTINGAGLVLAKPVTIANLYAKQSTITLAHGASLVQTGTRSLDCSTLRLVLGGEPHEDGVALLVAPGGLVNWQSMQVDGLGAGRELVYDSTTKTLSLKSKQGFRVPTVDVLVAYDNGAQAYVANKGVTLEEFAQEQIKKMNDVLVTNKLDRFYSYRLAGVCKVDGTYGDINSAPGLAAAGVDAAVGLRAAREFYGADTVTLLVDTSGATIGNSSPLSSSSDVAGQHECAFSVCSIRAVDTGKQHTMIHENAHNMGCGHARAQGNNICSPFAYGRGFYFKDGDITRHTIMAYGGDNDASWYFSTSSSEFGLVLGDADNDNARVLRETCSYVAEWRNALKTYSDEAIVFVDGTGEEVYSGRMFVNKISIRLASPIEGASIYYTFNGFDPTIEAIEDDEEWVFEYSSAYPVVNITADKTLSVALRPAGADYLLPVRKVKFIRCDLLANAVDATWQTGLKYPWAVESDTIRSYNQTDYKYQCTTPLRATVVGPKRLSFSHKSYFGGITVAGEGNYSHFDVLVDDSPVFTQTECTNEWEAAAIDIPDGTHEVTFVFSQRYAMNNPSDNKDLTPEADDAVWLKDIALEDIQTLECKHSSTSDDVDWVFPYDYEATAIDGNLGGIEVGSKGVVETLNFSTNAVCASVLAELPEGAAGIIIGCQLKRNAETFYAFAYSNGNGTFSLGHTDTTDTATSSAVENWTAPHVWTFAFGAQTGAKLYCDGKEIASTTVIKWASSEISGPITFGNDRRNKYPLPGMKIYSVHTDFGVGSAIFERTDDSADQTLQQLGVLADFAGQNVANQLAALNLYRETGAINPEVADSSVLRISEIMPKPTDALNRGALEGMDVNGLESGWVEVENTSDQWADLADYRFIRVNRGKKTDPAGVGNFPSRLVPPRSRAIFYTSERYSNSKDQAVSAFEHGTFDGKPMVMGNDLHNILVWGDKVNPKKSPYVRLYYAPGGDSDSGMVVDTVVVPSDLPEGWSIIVGQAGENEGTRRWLCPTPTRGRANTSTDGLKRIGPNVGPLYEKKGQKKTDLANEFAVPVPPATPGEDYVVTLPVNGVMNPDGTFTPRAADKIQSLKFVFRKDLDDSTLVTNNIDMATKTTDANWGDQYTATIPSDFFPEAGHLMQWKVLITDGEGVEWTSPSFNNPDDGYEWYGTIVEPDTATQMSATLPTWHMFASGNHLTQMDVDADKQDRSLVPNQARVAIYDSSTSNYYDYVRIDLRGNTSAGFTKKGHGLRFAKAHPLTMTDVVTGEPIEEIRKTSLISEFADPSCMRQMIAFWLWRKMGNLVPFDFPVRCNLNGEFYQLAFNSERFTDELIEDVYGLDKFGYSYKNVGTLKSGSSTTAGSIEKKTPDDENESDITVLQNELRSKITAAQQVSPDGGDTGLDNAELTKFVVQKFNLPAWLNYLASARITQEMDDVWANVCIYYDNPDMKEGARGTGTWMPLGYDFNLTFGQHYRDGGMGASGLKAQDDWFKCHPLYGGNRVRCYASPAMTSTINKGNDGFEAVWQSSKFRRLYLRRLRTLMDQQLKEPGTAEGDTPFMAKMREMADFMRTDAALDLAKWPDNGSDDAIDVWPSNGRPANMDAGIQDIWNNYVVPRREHLYVTHSVTNTAKEVGYGSNLNAGIPEAQSPIETLAPNISISNLTALDAAEAEALGVAGQLYDTEVVVIRNDNAEVVDMSGWRLAFSVGFTFPAGTVCDANDSIYIVADRRAYIDAHDSELTDQVIVGNATFTGAGPVALYDADGALVYSAIPQTDELKYLRLHSFYGNTLDGGDAGEWFALTNVSDTVTLDLAGVTVCFLKQGDPEEGTAHCHVTLTNKKGKGDVKPLKAWTASQADYTEKGWSKIQNNKQQITIYDKYGSVCQSLKVTQKNFPLAYGKGGYLVCDSIDASVTKDSQWHEALYEIPNNGESSEPFAADSQEAADELVANAKPALSDDDVYAGLEPQYLKIVAQPVDGEAGKYKAAVVVNPDTAGVPVMAQIEDGETTIDPLTVESDEEGSKVTVGVSNATVGLWYGFIWTDSLGDKPFENDVESFKRATFTSVKIESKAEAAKSAQKAFFRVKVLPAKPK